MLLEAALKDELTGVKLHQIAKHFAYCQFAKDAKRLRSDRINVSNGSPFPLETRRFSRKSF